MLGEALDEHGGKLQCLLLNVQLKFPRYNDIKRVGSLTHLRHLRKLALPAHVLFGCRTRDSRLGLEDGIGLDDLHDIFPQSLEDLTITDAALGDLAIEEMLAELLADGSAPNLQRVTLERHHRTGHLTQIPGWTSSQSKNVFIVGKKTNSDGDAKLVHTCPVWIQTCHDDKC